MFTGTQTKTIDVNCAGIRACFENPLLNNRPRGAMLANTSVLFLSDTIVAVSSLAFLRPLNLLAAYVGSVIYDPVLEARDVRRVISSQLGDLVAVTLGASRDAMAVAAGRGVRAARLRAIKDDIEIHLSDAELSPVAVAQRQHISDSYIRKLFEGEGTTFSEFVLKRRLTRAHRQLSDPRWLGRSILEIAHESGFGDLSYFNRSFKRCYGATPSDVRKAT